MGTRMLEAQLLVRLSSARACATSWRDFLQLGMFLDQWFQKWAVPPPPGAVKQKWAVWGR